ncbi:hypothetical protein [Kutzneria kofuensis]|uniref:Uncharacterized protein n=1 Tax=Kutzneria kofuensis TaxID=103725 RepID=A0A7W9NJZ2_9PSEU|nr:hypothetical protein [Kutzneria kofuensis]MBB5896152.1 hypothetical protein [Kutzneria kofuensis]
MNPHGTGCLSAARTSVGSPGFFWDPHYVLLGVTFAGAPAAPDPASVYSGQQVLLEKTDGTTFPNGDAWKCITCGVPAANEQGVDTTSFTYPPPHAFPGDRRVLVGNGVLDCGPYQVSDARCTPGNTRIYPIELGGKPLGGAIGGGLTREWRLNPDGVHLGWNTEVPAGDFFDEFGSMGRLVFDQAGRRYDLTDVSLLFNRAPDYQPYVVRPGNVLTFNPAGMVGEFRGWSADGRSALGIQSYESDSIDAWETSLATGESRPLTRHAEYTDPMFASPDGRWLIAEEVLDSGRLHFISGMPGIPPVTDQLPSTAYVSGIRNNGERRFFLPYLVNAATGASAQVNPGADPNWNAGADPVWLADSSAVVWAENLVTAPDCGGAHPLPCPVSTEPGGRHSRVMIARFPALPASTPVPPAPVSDAVPWGTPYTVGQPFPTRPHLPAGTYSLPGAVCGTATVVITTDDTDALITRIEVGYTGFDNDGSDIINGTESIARDSDSAISAVTWHENLTLTGRHTGAKVTSPDGLTLSPQVMDSDFQATGTMTTTIDGQVYTQPGNGD